jgi:hypothetical protein
VFLFFFDVLVVQARAVFHFLEGRSDVLGCQQGYLAPVQVLLALRQDLANSEGSTRRIH